MDTFGLHFHFYSLETRASFIDNLCGFMILATPTISELSMVRAANTQPDWNLQKYKDEAPTSKEEWAHLC